jgi:TatA/E family protein of Tat protein translocase
MFLAFLEFLGTTELLVILFAALVLFGPRKLPQLSRKLGRSLTEFKRASEDFKRTWEKEVEMEKLEEEARSARSMLEDDRSIIGEPGDRRSALEASAAETDVTSIEPLEPTVARAPASPAPEPPVAPLVTEAAPPEGSGKRDWL